MSRGRLLLVEDNRTTAALLASALTRAGWEVTTVADAWAALRAALDGAAPHVVLCDVCLPDGDGVALLTLFQHKPGLARAHCLAMTALAGKDLEVARLSCATRLPAPAQALHGGATARGSGEKR